MSRVYLIRDGRGERELGEANLPLRVGGEDCELVVPGLSDAGPLAYIALSEGHAYLQPTSELPVYHNHERRTDSAWLKSGDRVQMGDAVLHWEVRGDQVFVTLAQGRSEPPPVLTPPPAPPGGPVAPGAPEVRVAPTWLRYLVAIPFLALLVAATFLLAAVPVTIEIEPVPERLEVLGLPPAIPLGGRYLMLPGSYRVEASREGYAPLAEILKIQSDGARTFAYKLAELPGRLTLRVEPEVSWRLLVDGTPADAGTDGLVELPGGRHLLRVEADRYLPEERELEIAGLGRAQELALRLRPAWASLEIVSEPPGARVEMDGRVLGVTPLREEILQGRRALSLSLEGYKPEQRELEVQAGQDQRVELQLAPADGRLRLDSEPSGASVSLDGSYLGTTPLEVDLAPGREHRLHLAKAGYRAAEHSLSVAADEDRALSVSLEPEYGIVFLTSRPADASLAVDGKPAGKATQRLRLTVRRHTLEVSSPGYASQRLEVTPKVGVSQSLDVALKTLKQARIEATPVSVTTAAGQVLRLVRPGAAFEMGASRREPGRRSNENQRLVQLTRPFYLGEKEVSNAEFRLFAPGHSSGSAEGVSLDRDDQPVARVSWEDAARYCNWLSARDGLPAFYREAGGKLEPVSPPNSGYRLPTEAEWAYVARVLGRSKPARYPWGEGYPPTGKVGNFADARISDALVDVVPGYDDGFRVAAAPGSFPPDPGGWYDLGGNVAEWANDYYAVYPGNAGQLAQDPMGPATGDHHAVRGSSWRHGNITELRLSYRDYSREPRDDLGFRIARYAE